MKLSNSKNGGGNLSKGFVVSGVLYPIFILVVFLTVQILTMLETRRMILDKNRNQLVDSIDANNQVYSNEQLSARLDALEGKLYPVGSIYISIENTNPSTIYGGTWVAFGTGRTLVGVDTGQTEFNTVEKTGGHKSLQAHTHTMDSAGAHTHTANSAGAHTYYD